MKRILYLLTALLCANFALKAAPGDTTVVNANNTRLVYYGSYDTTIMFPTAAKTYRRVYMIFTLGKYTCPGYTYGTGSVPWCGDWDYTVQNYLITKTGETFELGRLITPYANGSAPRTPYTWQQHYVYDVTDYVSKLTDSATMRIFYSGYSGGFTANIKFEFIEGTPDRTVMGISRLWNGSYSYGDTSHGGANNINNHFTTRTESAPAGTQSTDLKFTVTGHGSDPNYCNEFCSHNYNVLLNGATVGTQTIWRSNCGANELYPQSGTWIYQRANWCPGAMVYSNDNYLPGIIGGTTFNTAIQFEDYIGNGGASYTTEATLIYYGGLNKTLDATMEHIISPTIDENYFRENPICATPVINIKNTGATTITSMTIQYGVSGTTPLTYNWTGSLASLQDADITLPALPAISAEAGTTGTYGFSATILSVNGAADDDATNNTLQSQFVAAPMWPSTFRILFNTNNETISSASTICETSWIIYDVNNNIVTSRQNAEISSSYNDTINLLPGDYRLQVYDSSCDGLAWWGFSGSGVTDGSITAIKTTGTHANIPFNAFSYSGGYPDDFGCGFTQYFTVYWPAAIAEVNATPQSITAYPNPAQNVVNIDLDGMPSAVDGTFTIIDALGRSILQQKCNDIHSQLNTSSLTGGVYIVEFTDANSNNKLQAHIVIAK